MTPPRRMLFLAILALSAGAASAARASTEAADDGRFYQLTGEPPPGFEHLVAPQQALVDVYYGDVPVVSTLATYEPGRIELTDPQVVVNALTDLLDRNRVLSALSGPLPTHEDALCAGSRRSGCGVIEPEVAGVIFDAERFRVDVFVNPESRARARAQIDKFLPASNSDLSYLQNLTLNAAGSDAGADVYSVSSFSTLAYRENRLNSVVSYTDQDELTLDQFFGQRDFEGNQHVAGLFRTVGSATSFASEADLIGYRVATSLTTRVDLAVARGTPLELFLLTPARVDVIKDNRLLSSRMYPAGNQFLDTANLPEGAYDVTLRISEGGRVREETRFFSKTSRIPPLDQALRSIEIGRVVNRSTTDFLPEDTGTWYSRAGYTRRLTDAFGIDIGIASTQREQLLEAGIFQMDRLPGDFDGFYQVEAGTFLSKDNDYGFTLTSLIRHGRFAASLNYRKITRGDAEAAGLEDPTQFSLVPEDRTEQSAAMRMPIGAGTLSLSTTRTERRWGDSSDSHNLNVRYPFRFGNRSFLELTADLSLIDGDMAAIIGLRANLWSGPWTVEVAPRYQHSEQDDGYGSDSNGVQLDSLLTYADRDSRVGDLRTSLSAGSGTVEDRLGGSLSIENVLARSDLDVTHVVRDGNDVNSWTASVSTSALATGDTWAFGAQNAAASAVVVNLEGYAPGVNFEVLIDGYRRGYAPAGRATAIHLAPFRTYEVRVRPLRGEFVAYQDRVQSVTLYPGNVARLTWEVGQLIVVVGTLTDARTGGPLTGGVLDNGYGLATTTDENGNFQAEMMRPTGPLKLEFHRGDERCTATVTEFEETAGVSLVDTVACQPDATPSPQSVAILSGASAG